MNNQKPRPAALNSLSRASIRDTLGVMKDVVLPTLGKGPLLRRRKVVRLAESAKLTEKAVARLQALRRKHGPGPLLMRIPFRPHAVILTADDAAAVLEASPEPFEAASEEKRAALDHFQPGAVLASRGHDREIRRTLNEQTLQTGCPLHTFAPHFATVADEEMGEVCRTALGSGTLDWDTFFTGWYRMVRRIVLGDGARDDSDLTDLLEDLRGRANYAFLRRKDRASRQKMLDRVSFYVDRAEPNSLAGRMAEFCTDPNQKPHHQLPHYLFAFDPGGMASFRTLALLSAHPAIEQQVRKELSQAEGDDVARLDLLRACFLDSLRLWPTTPAILRETTRAVPCGEGKLESGTQVLIFTPFLHRDAETLPQANAFDPGLWANGNSRPDLGLFPFSEGPVVCPAIEFVPWVASMALRSILNRVRPTLSDADRVQPGNLPGTLDNYTLSFSLTPAGH
jgi:hypothetical protein